MSRSGYLILLSLFVGTSVNIMFDQVAQANDLDNAYEFLKTNVVNRTLLRESQGTLADGKVGYMFRREATVCNLHRTERGLQFDHFVIIKQQNWDIKDDSSKGDPRNEDRMVVIRYEFAMRKSTSRLVGFSRTLSGTPGATGAEGEAARLIVTDAQLTIESHIPFYADAFDKGGSWYPGAMERTQVFRIENGKLVMESSQKSFRVDPATLKREAISDSNSNVVEKEISRLPSS